MYTLQYRNGVERSKQSGAVGTKKNGKYRDETYYWPIYCTASTSAIYAEKQ